jgi:hypothetical protein
MALWQQPNNPPELPPAKDDMQGTNNLLLRGMESPITAYALLAGTLYCVGSAALAGSAAWNEYFKLLLESRFVHVTTVDFLTLTTLAPFWMANDAALRRWPQQESLLPVLSLLPLVGPVIYLCLRPKAEQ